MGIKTNDIVIIGGGPAGIAAAIQLKLYGLNPIIFEKNKIGGLIRNANNIENYPGIPGSINGRKFAENLNKQADKNDLNILYEEVTKVKYTRDRFNLFYKDQVIQSDYLIIATGTKPNTIKFKNLEKLEGDKVFYDLEFLYNVQNKDIGIIGSGDAAFDYSSNLSKKNSVKIFSRNDNIHCNVKLLKSVQNNKSIVHFQNYTLKEAIQTRNKLEIKFQTKTGIVDVELDYLLIAIGREAENSFIDRYFAKKIDSLILQNKLFLIGDLVNGRKRQLSIATGDGIKAAMEINQSLSFSK